MNLIPRRNHSLFDNFFGGVLPALDTTDFFDNDFFSPSVDIEEQDDHYLVTADLPGVNKDDINITLENGVLTLEAKRSEESEEKKKGKVIRRERRSGSFARSFNVGSQLKDADIHAEFKNGVLKLTLPRLQEAPPSSHRIAVK